MKKKPLIILCAVLVLLIVLGTVILPRLISTTPSFTTAATSDEGDVAKYRAYYGNMATGYCEDQADDLRQSILNTKNTEEIYNITGTKYYISSTEGDDNNDGLSPEKPFKTLQALKELYTCDGDAILFKRGDTFRFGEALKVRHEITYGSYGQGAKPKIYGSPENYAQNTAWEKVEDNIWKIAFEYKEACGLVINHSEIVGINKYTGIDTLSANGDYYHDTENNVFYLYCDKGKPNEVYEDIEIMPSATLIKLPDSARSIVIDNLCLIYTSASAINGSTPNGLHITNCEIGFTGGKWVGSDHKLRYGNAIEFWNGAKDTTIKNNWIYQTYDSAFTWQGNNGGTYQNISLEGNLFEYNNADIEFFDRNGSTFDNIVMKENLMRFTSMGWGTRETDGGIRGIEGVIRAVTGTRGEAKAVDIKSIYFTNNTLDCPARQTINWNWDLAQKEFIHFSGTKLYIKEGYRTLTPCLQGFQTEEGHEYDRRFAENEKDLKKGFEIFEQGAKIYWYK